MHILSLKTDSQTSQHRPQPNVLSSTDVLSQYLPLFLGVLGSALLFVGVFTPLISLPIVGNLNYFQNGKGDGTLILVFAGMSLFLVLTKRFKGLLITSVLSVLILAFTFFKFQWFMGGARNEIIKSDNPFKGLGNTMLDTIQLQWGWAVLIIGVGLLFAAAIVKGRIKKENGVGSVKGNTDLYAAITLASLIITGWIYFAAIPQFSNGSNALFGTKDTAENKSVPKEKELSELLEPLRMALTVSISTKKFIGANIYSGRILDELSFRIQQSNNSGKDIRGFKGAFVFKDLFDDEITKISFKSDQILGSGQIKKETLSMNYNQFVEAHQKLRSTSIENLRIEWQPDTIIFTDGTGLSLNGEQSFSIPDKPSTKNTSTTEDQMDSSPVPKKQVHLGKSKATPNDESSANGDSGKEESVGDDSKNTEKPTESKKTKPLAAYEANTVVIRLPDGRMRLVAQ